MCGKRALGVLGMSSGVSGVVTECNLRALSVNYECQWLFQGVGVSRAFSIAEAPWSAAEWAEALRFVELLQAQLGRQVPYYY